MSESQTISPPRVKTDEKVKHPSMHAVVVHNDSFTPRGFVIEVLRRFFRKTEPEATTIMMTAHRSGHAVVEVYTLEMAETKAAQANKYSKDEGKLLLFSVEEQ